MSDAAEYVNHIDGCQCSDFCRERVTSDERRFLATAQPMTVDQIEAWRLCVARECAHNLLHPGLSVYRVLATIDDLRKRLEAAEQLAQSNEIAARSIQRHAQEVEGRLEKARTIAAIQTHSATCTKRRCKTCNDIHSAPYPRQYPGQQHRFEPSPCDCFVSDLLAALSTQNGEQS